jgi:hypothetical protein
MKPQRTVFYVDDHPKALKMLTSVLEGCGYKVLLPALQARRWKAWNAQHLTRS